MPHLEPNHKDFFPAHRIRISDILSWVRNSYLTHVILPRLSKEDCSFRRVLTQGYSIALQDKWVAKATHPYDIITRS